VPPNNAAIMGSAPARQSGTAGGVLNMTRGLGTSLGLALASLVYTVGAGSRAGSAHQATTGYVDTAVFLACVAAAAALVSVLRGPVTDSRSGTGRDPERGRPPPPDATPVL
jgi:hypothetical protein